ncbi:MULTISPECIES: chemotaxis response regulator protein-glutamate methylesterase [Bradyrhizobium]|jgi:two-component system chemotaxis response regulator CheB|uniref:Protein-glutamate methylesterase/protein-glutamine glutaminase n=4 Tax=Pseudomonadota TaxID=1224 RepID=A0ABS5G339_9BRAD|nr:MULTISPECIES: chemotaxis response regulator protein-glutamate methylesterase [Bradyrhizobium]RTM06033.1 MAG: chemotaxis response regulator protein-glutamate methylesterase [Bradyrhizobiaceae bacterium]ABQ34334.1 Chemotaxis Response Regulator protein CheB-glutamate methylesterase [Bradyrhizobium sp. BTAi1]MBR1135625.1 chemotaxis response regulator protein-glutamate methylesterase [Bradyrhizobium denitrificans]MCL8482630.1 chemotaxis response regulator protein-glutamate methylesterase [Bradyrh
MSAIRVLIVDDSAFVRQMLTDLLSSDPGIEVLGAAPNPIVARDMIKSLNPDVLTLDIEMPRMDGLAFLDKIMTLRPMPVLMISSLTQKGADTAVRALEMGAFDCVAKPVIGLVEGLPALRDEIVTKVKAAAAAKIRPRSGDEVRPLHRPGVSYSSSEKIIAVGASTGGVEALQELLMAFPSDAPAVVITQHMPAMFTASFANRLNQLCAVTVKQAESGERVLPGHAYIAPGGCHLELARNGANYVCRVHDEPAVSGHRPSVDVLFRSVAHAAGLNAIGVILTGMGRDGALGLLEMRSAGASTIGQDEATCVVYGMPKAARECGAVEIELPLNKIADQVLKRCESLAARGVRV